MITYFVVQSFSQGRKGTITADLPMQLPSGDQAKRRALRLSESKLGVVAFSRSGDPSTGDYEDAVVLARYGIIPEEEQQLALAS